jgi:hypothetical protein
MIHVLNKKTDSLPDGWIYIGRENRKYMLAESPLHNPWPLQKESDRTELLAKYKRHHWGELKRRHSPARLEVFRLVRLARQGDVHLGCFCKPKDCHGDLIKKAVEWIIAEGISEMDDLSLRFPAPLKPDRLV